MQQVQWRPRVIDVAVLCLVGFAALILTVIAVGAVFDRDPAGIPWVLAAVGLDLLTALIWRNGPVAPLARLLGLAAVIAILGSSGSILPAIAVGVLLAIDLTQARRPTT